MQSARGILNICFIPQKKGQKRPRIAKMTGWGDDKASKSEAEIQRYKLLLFFLIPCLLYFFLSQCIGSLLWDGNCCSDCPPWESRKIQFHRYTRRIERWGWRKKSLLKKKKSRYRGGRHKKAWKAKGERRKTWQKWETAWKEVHWGMGGADC